MRVLWIELCLCLWLVEIGMILITLDKYERAFYWFICWMTKTILFAWFCEVDLFKLVLLYVTLAWGSLYCYLLHWLMFGTTLWNCGSWNSGQVICTYFWRLAVSIYLVTCIVNTIYWISVMKVDINCLCIAIENLRSGETQWLIYLVWLLLWPSWHVDVYFVLCCVARYFE